MTAEIIDLASRIYSHSKADPEYARKVLQTSIEAGELIASYLRQVEALMIDGPQFQDTTLNQIVHDNSQSARVTAEIWEAQVSRAKWILTRIEKFKEQPQPKGEIDGQA